MPAVDTTTLDYIVIDKGALMRIRTCYPPAPFLYAIAQSTKMNDRDKPFQTVRKRDAVAKFCQPLNEDGLKVYFIRRHVTSNGPRETVIER